MPGAALEEAQGEMVHGAAVMLWDLEVRGGGAPLGASHSVLVVLAPHFSASMTQQCGEHCWPLRSAGH